jgi:hypothetical protein
MAKARRKAGTRLITGVEDLDAKLATLKLGAANKIARPALTKAARHLLKKVKAAVPPDKKEAKKAMGMVVDAKGGKSRDLQRAKVGAAVGKASKVAGNPRRAGRPGVGMDARNIHWFILGTAQRSTGTTRIRSKLGLGQRKLTGGVVRNTGIMPPQMEDVVKGPARAEQGAMIGIMRAEATTRLAKLAAKK